MAEALNGRAAIVVGASSGMGRASASLLAQQGAQVMLAARRTRQLEQLRSESESTPGRVDVCATDSTSRADVKRLIATTLDPLDVAEAVLFVARLHPRAVVPQMQLLPSAL